MDFSNTSDILAGIAIIVSIASAAYQWYLDSHMNKVNLEADDFRTLYSKHLLYELPKAWMYIRFKNGKLVDIENTLIELNAIRKDSLYFLYADKDFYTDIKIELQNLENFLIETAEEKLESQEEQQNVLNQIHSRLEMIYKIFNSKYIGN